MLRRADDSHVFRTDSCLSVWNCWASVLQPVKPVEETVEVFVVNHFLPEGSSPICKIFLFAVSIITHTHLILLSKAAHDRTKQSL